MARAVQLSRLASGPTALMLARVPVLLSGLLVAPLIARELGPEGRGLAAAATAALAVTSVVLGLGVPLAVRRAASLGGAEPVLRGARLISIALVVPAGALGLCLASLVLPGAGRSVVLAFVVSMAATPMFVQALNDQSVLIARGSFWRIATLQTCQPLAYAGAIAVGWALGGLTLTWLLWSYALSLAVAGMVGSALVGVGLRGASTSAVSLVRQGLPYAPSQAAEAATSRLDQVLMVSVIGAEGAGLYAVAALLGGLPLVLGQALAVAVFPRMAGLASEERPRARAEVVRATLLVAATGGAALAALSPALVPWLFGEAFDGAVAPSVILCAAAPLSVLAYVATNLLAAEGRGHEMTAAQTAGLTVGILSLVLVLGPHLEAVGAALASVLGYATVVVVALATLRVSPMQALRIGVSDLSAVRRILSGR